MIVAPDFLMYEATLSNSRDSRVFRFVVTGTWAIAIRFLPDWMIDSRV